VAKKSPAKVKLIKPSKDKATTSKPASKSSSGKVAAAGKSVSKPVAKTAAKPVTKPSTKPSTKAAASTSTKSVKAPAAGSAKVASAVKTPAKAPAKAPVAKVAAAKTGASKAPTASATPVKAPVIKPAAPTPTIVSSKAKTIQAPIPARGSDNAGTSGALTDEQLLKAKSGLSKRDVDQYRKVLMDKRAEILGDVASLETDARNKNTGGNLSNMPVHMADIGTDNFQQEFTLGLVESERKLLAEINAALLRVQKGTFGVCLETAKPIGKPRLDATPWARYCIEVARDMERRGRRI
jgi:DnaK suppressor protein